MRFYTTQHLWIEQDSIGSYFVGLTQEGLAELSDVAHIELPKVGGLLRPIDPFLVVESTKAAYEINFPFEALVLECYPVDLKAPHLKPLVRVQMAFSEKDGAVMSLKSYESYLN